MRIYGFEKLEVWQDARKLVTTIYGLTKTFPASESFSFKNQLRRASLSIASNVAEGSGRKSAKDQVHFYNMAYSSTLELLNGLIIANDLQYCSSEQLNECRSQIEKITFKLNKLRDSLQAKID